jgi:RNA polymerase sigma-B factor
MNKWLSKEESYILIMKAQQGDEDAKMQLYYGYKKFITHIVNKLKPGRYFEDYYQSGCEGFVKAINAFDISLGYSFTTFMEPKVRGEILRLVRDYNLITSVRFTREIKEIGRRILRLSHDTGKDYEMIIKDLELSLSIADEVMAYLLPALSLQKTVGEDKRDSDKVKLQDTIAIPGACEDIWENILLHEIVNQLTGEERMIFELRFIKNLTQTEASKIVGISQTQVSKKEQKLKHKMCEYLGIAI